MTMVRKVDVLHILYIVFLLQCACSQEANTPMPFRCIARERQALLMFKHGVEDSAEILTSVSLWGSEGYTKDCCEWEGVGCNNLTGHVTSLDLYGLKHISINMTSSLVELKSLESLKLESNDFGISTIPNFICSLTSLKTLDLSSCNLRGLIPYQLKNLSNLEYLDLSRNEFESNTIPEFISSFTKLESLNLAYSNLGGIIPHQLGNLSKLSYLYLSNNNLNGAIPYQLGNLSKLSSLDLSYNHYLSGVISHQLGNLRELSSLDLSHNNLSGAIPHQLGNLSKLKILKLNDNNDLLMRDSKWLSRLSSLTDLYLSGIDLSRTAGLQFDDIFKALPLISELRLDYCNLTGFLASSISSPNSSSSSGSLLFISSHNLTYLDLSNNHLTGTLPAFRDCPSLVTLDLSYNQFSVFLPETFGHVPNLTILDISRNSLEVVINKEHLSNLSSLLDLDLSFNVNISFNLSPQHVSHLHLIGLYLRSCKSGPRFPHWIMSQKKLERLDFSGNEISESIPAWFWNLTSDQMYYLNISSNGITGTLSSHAPAYQRLSYLDLSYNHLSGEIPDWWLNFENVVVLNLGHNNLSGKIPNSLGLLKDLQVLNLQSNKLTGELPILLKNCTSLSFLNLGVNKFSGSIPTWMGDMSQLYFLVMRKNEFLGSIPLQLCRLRNLQFLDLHGNDISGEVPGCFNNFSAMVQPQTQSTYHSFRFGKEYSIRYSDKADVLWKGVEREFGENLKYMKSIDLSGNKLNGELPQTMFSLVELVALNLSNNDLRGNIPLEIGNLKLLESLDLSNNRFSGGIPATMSHLTFLSYLNLSSNNLSGKIPEVTQLQSFNASAYAGNDALCGAPLEQKCHGKEQPSQVPFVSTKDDEETDEFDRWFYVAAALGFSTTFWGVSGALFLNRRWRHAYFLYLYNLKDRIYVAFYLFIAKIRRTCNRNNTV